MAATIAAVVVVILAAASTSTHASTVFTVGDSTGWTLGRVNYTDWASGKTFVVGDVLLFTYDRTSHDVLVVKQSDYNTCTATNPTTTFRGGNDSYPLATAGAHYFICGTAGHCGAGMKLAVNVSPAGAVPPAASPPPSSSGGGSGGEPVPSTPAGVSPSGSTPPPPPNAAAGGGGAVTFAGAAAMVAALGLLVA